MDGKDQRVDKKMFWERQGQCELMGKSAHLKKIKRGVRQGCVLSQDHFSLYSEMIMPNLDNQELKYEGTT